MTSFAIKLGTYALGTEAAVSALKIVTNRRIDEYPIIRNDMTIIPTGNMKPIRIDVTGTIAGSGYTALRTALQDLRRALETGKESFYIDSDRYCRVLSKSFDYGFITSDFANYNISFIGELPYFLAVGTSYNAYAVGTSALTYPISSSGDVQIPVKVSVKAPAGGIPAGTNITFENKTLGLLC